MPARLLHLAATDKGGAGRAALRLHRAMLARGVQSDMIVWDREADSPGLHEVANKPVAARLRRFVGRSWFRVASRRKYFFRNQRCSTAGSTRLVNQVQHLSPDAIVLHYISDFLSFSDIADLQAATGARVVWNLLDMAHLTGGCHYAWDCNGYEAVCGDCPALTQSGPDDASRRTMREKREGLAALDHIVVAPSSSVEAQARRSSLFADSDIRRILIGIDPADIPDTERAVARRTLDLPVEGSILFFGAQTLNDHRKGMDVLVAALKAVRSALTDDQTLPLLLVAGGGEGAGELERLGFPTRMLGYISADRLATAYAAADFFLCPSIEDSGPMMVNEAVMAGTPTIAFSIGVVPDLVIEGKTGLIAPAKTPAALASAILQGLSWDAQQRAAARQTCRSTALERCSLDVQVAQMLALAPTRAGTVAASTHA